MPHEPKEFKGEWTKNTFLLLHPSLLRNERGFHATNPFWISPGYFPPRHVQFQVAPVSFCAQVAFSKDGNRTALTDKDYHSSLVS